MSHHAITWTLSGYGLASGEASCSAPEGADCRLVGTDCQCEEWGEILRDEQGRPYHLPGDGYDADASEMRHYMHDQGECNVVNYLNDSYIEELGPDDGVTLAALPIEPVWDDLGFRWKPAVS